MTDARTTAPATCVFAVCPAGRAPDLAGVPGHAEATGRLRVLRAGPLDAVVQSVPAAAFSQEELRRRLSDPVALEVCARAHHEVVAAVAKSAPTVPLPLATLYFGDDRAAEALAARTERFLAVLDRVTGREEWGVKVSLAHAPPADAPAGEDGPAPPPSGRAYLDRLRARRDARAARRDAAAAAAERVDAALRRLAVAARRLRPHEAAARAGRPQVLNAAYLVDTARAPELVAAADALAREPDVAAHVTVEVTGPWAPYSFASADEPDEPDGPEGPDGPGSEDAG